MRKRVVFYGNFNENDINIFDYYKQDYDALTSLGFDVVFCNKITKLFFLKFDLIFIWWWTYAALPILISKFKNSKSIVTGTFNFKFEDAKSGIDYIHRPIYQKFLIWVSLKLTNYNLFVNYKEFLECSKFFKLKNSVYFPHVVNDIYINKNIGKKNNFLLNISWSGKKNLERKGVFDLIQALYLLKLENIDIDLIIAGKDGDGLSDLNSLINKLNINDRVKLLGTITLKDKINLLQNCIIYVQPSYFEGFGLAVAEAMASGACILSSQVGGMGELVKDVSFFVEPGNIQMLVNQIKFILNNSKQREYLQNEAQKKIVSKYSFDKKVINLKKILNNEL
jgi:glycosyltransferase involved in cell wall biosynthesis